MEKKQSCRPIGTNKNENMGVSLDPLNPRILEPYFQKKKWTTILKIAVVILSVLVGGCSSDDTTNANDEAIQQSKNAIEKYQDVSEAVKDGYQSSSEFVSTSEGGQGIYFVNSSIEGVDSTRPQALLYSMTDDGQYELLGAKWFVPESSVQTAPTLFGQTFNGPYAGDNATDTTHYDLYAWLFMENLNGMFEEYNPDLTIPSIVEDSANSKTSLAKYQDVAEAIKDGYIDTEEFISSEDGGMGISFYNSTITEIDAAKPQVLLYTIKDGGDGEYELLGAKWLVPEDSVSTVPVLFGQTFNGPIDSYVPAIPSHYSLDSWLFKTNPDGMFARFNPDVQSPAFMADFATTRESLSKYKDVSKAIEDGYESSYDFTSSLEGVGVTGGVWMHFVNPSIIGMDDITKPNLLIYTFTEDGKYELLGAEWFVPEDVVDTAPVLFGQTFKGPMDGHGPESHYDLHAWLFKTNPLGVFAEYNPNAGEPSFAKEFTEARDYLSKYKDIQVAEAEGYVQSGGCIEVLAAGGGMGIHYARESFSGIDAKDPGVLLYVENSEGGLELVSVEYFAPEYAVAEAPVMFNQTYKGPMDGHVGDEPRHYELHVGMYKINPSGLFEDFNPLITCP